VTGFVIKSNDGGHLPRPGGLHIMLMGLKQPLKLGQTFPVTLDLRQGRPGRDHRHRPAAETAQAQHEGMKM